MNTEQELQRFPAGTRFNIRRTLQSGQVTYINERNHTLEDEQARGTVYSADEVRKFFSVYHPGMESNQYELVTAKKEA